MRRLGYLLERLGHARQVEGLPPFVKGAKSPVLRDPSVKPLIEGLAESHDTAPKWMLVINEAVQIDS